MSLENDANSTSPAVAGAASILVVEDDPQIRFLLRTGLTQAGYGVFEAGSAAKALAMLNKHPEIALVTLDIGLGRDDGLALLGHLQDVRPIPVIMLTARDEPLERVKGLETGAQDYIIKPFHLREVIIRVESVLRRAGGAPAPAMAQGSVLGYRFFAGYLDVRRREVITLDGGRLVLTSAEFDVLGLLIAQAGRVISRDEIMMRLRGREWSPYDRSIDGIIARLRKKLEPDIANPEHLKTVWRAGYVFASPVETIQGTP